MIAEYMALAVGALVLLGVALLVWRQPVRIRRPEETIAEPTRRELHNIDALRREATRQTQRSRARRGYDDR